MLHVISLLVFTDQDITPISPNRTQYFGEDCGATGTVCQEICKDRRESVAVQCDDFVIFAWFKPIEVRFEFLFVLVPEPRQYQTT